MFTQSKNALRAARRYRCGVQPHRRLVWELCLNPWFVQVEQVPMVQIPIGYVGVVISYVGKAHVDVSGLEFKHGDLVEQGHKGVWVTPLYLGKQAIDTLIGDINPPAQLMQTQTDRKIAEEQRKTYEMQEAAQVQRQQLVRQTSLADIQQQVVGAEQGVNIAELQANAQVKHATGEAEAVRLRAHGEAEAIRATGTAKAEAYRVGVESLGSQAYTVMQLMQIVGDRNVRIVPDVAVTGTSANPGIVDGLLGLMLRNQSNGQPK